MSNAPPLWGDSEPIISATEAPRRPRPRRKRFPNGPPTDIIVWLLQNEPQDFGELMDLRRALYGRQTHGKYRISGCGVTLLGEDRFVVTGPAGPLLILSNKSRHFLLRTLCRLRRKRRWPPIKYQMTVCPITCRQELERVFTSLQFQNPAAVTLTLKKRAGSRLADPMVASENFRHFRIRLENRIPGRSARLHDRRLRIIAVLEMSADHHLHYHCKIDRPYHCSLERFSAIIRDQWSKTDFGYHQVDIQDQSDHGWTDYLLKQRQKGSLLDSIDWPNCHLDC